MLSCVEFAFRHLLASLASLGGDHPAEGWRSVQRKKEFVRVTLITRYFPRQLGSSWTLSVSTFVNKPRPDRTCSFLCTMETL